MVSRTSRRYLVVIAAGYLAGIAAYPMLPGPFLASHPASRLLVAFLLPTTAALIQVLVRRVWARDPFRDGGEAFEPTYDAILFTVVLFVVAMHLMVMAVLTGVLPGQAWPGRVTVVLFGLTAVRIGNLLPRTRPNLALGIRTPRTLANRSLWVQTHRVAGYVTVGLGSVFVVSGAFLAKETFHVVLGAAVLSATTLVVLWYYKYSHREPNPTV